MENIAGYVLDHTCRDEVRWRRLPAGERGPYLVSALHGPRRDEFLRLVRRHREISTGYNPLDGREHGLGEVTRWLGIAPLAIRFVGLGVILGVFELTSPWEAVVGEDCESVDRRLGRGDGWRFRLKGSRARIPSGRPGPAAEVAGCRRRPGPRRIRWTRCARARTGGIGPRG
jgi:hypothetical protein